MLISLHYSVEILLHLGLNQLFFISMLKIDQ